MEVKFEDREKDVEYFNLSLKIAGINSDYPNAELIYLIHKHVQAQGGKGTIDDIVTIKCNWEKKWDAYAKTTSSQT